MMDTRDRLEDVGKIIDNNNGKFISDGKELLNDYITKEELWACTSCADSILSRVVKFYFDLIN